MGEILTKCRQKSYKIAVNDNFKKYGNFVLMVASVVCQIFH